MQIICVWYIRIFTVFHQNCCCTKMLPILSLLKWLTRALGKPFCSMEKEDIKVLNKGEEEEMVRVFFFCSPLAAFLEFLFYIVLIWSIFLFIYFLRSYRATAYVIGVWSWWASGCCVRGAFSSCYSTGCQSGASNPPAPVPQPEMLKWFCCGLR